MKLSRQFNFLGNTTITDDTGSRQGSGGEVWEDPSLEHHLQKHPHIAHPPPPDAQARPQAGLEKNKEPGGIILKGTLPKPHLRLPLSQ